MGINWGAEDDFAQAVTQQADRVRSVPGHGLTDGQAYLVAAGNVVERRIVRIYRLAVWFVTALTIYVGVQTWYASGSLADSLAPMALVMLVSTALAFRLTRRRRWAGFSVGPYAREVEASLRRAQAGVHLLTTSGVIAGACLVLSIACTAWAIPTA
ncbi:hypothetical protein ACJ6WD_10755 [Streptomyces sp. VTCC 41912]|uniref:hypothetical protein n=1 Tax=Streptomyces sp. VTCC 41912 TaxID=3383243 RepID=UPI0038968A77